jgi:WD40 repeat protein
VVRSVAFATGGEDLAIGCWDGAVVIRDRRSGAIVATPELEADMVEALTYSGDGRHLAVCSRDGVAFVLETGTYTVEQTIDVWKLPPL